MNPAEQSRAGTPRRVLVLGSRTWVSPRVVRDALRKVWGDGRTVLVTGGSRTGADRLAETLWRRWGGQVERHPAQWRLHRPLADVCLAFAREPGGGRVVHLAESAGIPDRRHTQDPVQRARHTVNDLGRQRAGHDEEQQRVERVGRWAAGEQLDTTSTAGHGMASDPSLPDGGAGR